MQLREGVEADEDDRNDGAAYQLQAWRWLNYTSLCSLASTGQVLFRLVDLQYVFSVRNACSEKECLLEG